MLANECKFTVTCEMNKRWAPTFLGLLKRMESDGNIGHSEMIGFFSDGDGDYRPKFDFGDMKTTVDEGINGERKVNIFYDAG